MSNAEKTILDMRKQYKEIKHAEKGLEEMEKVMEDFQELIDRGLAEPRGYTLKAIDERGFSFSSNMGE